MKKTRSGFTIVELLVVIVVIAILAAISIIAYNGIQGRARDSGRMQVLNTISKGLEMYYGEKGSYPVIWDGRSHETSCGSQTDNWGHCDRNKTLTDALAPYVKIDPTSLSVPSDNIPGQYTYQSNGVGYGLSVKLEGNGGANDGGYYDDSYEVGSNIAYCMSTYTGTGRNWRWASVYTRCAGGN
ncbi:MAG TPA: prepilin-type N-terminal cleavage/methylation domain-containing protein [Candidatus Saccharimonadales bacterium]